MKPEGAKRLHVEPITFTMANEYVRVIHRHHGPTEAQFSLFALAAVDDDGLVCGVAIGAFPTAANRLTDGFRTLEVTRVATDGTPNACSILYAAAARAAKALGFSRVITYILDSESGTSVKAAGWKPDQGSFGNLSWADHSQRPGRAINVGPKGRWSLSLSPLDRPSLHLPEHACDPEFDQLALDA
jgi:hypothetical protein